MRNSEFTLTTLDSHLKQSSTNVSCRHDVADLLDHVDGK